MKELLMRIKSLFSEKELNETIPKTNTLKDDYFSDVTVTYVCTEKGSSIIASKKEKKKHLHYKSKLFKGNCVITIFGKDINDSFTINKELLNEIIKNI